MVGDINGAHVNLLRNAVNSGSSIKQSLYWDS